MMRPQIELITIVTHNLPAMRQFYEHVLGFKVLSSVDTFCEFEHEGVRFGLCTNTVMEEISGDPDFRTPPTGQRLELAFSCDGEAEVEAVYADLVAKGAKPIKGPSRMTWGQYTAFFADLDGNVHEVFTD